MIRVTVWNEYVHEREVAAIAAIYPEGIHGAIAAALGKEADFCVTTATLYNEECEKNPACGLPDDLLANTDVLVWWGHCRHWDVDDDTAERVQRAVLCGMGLIVLHSGHLSKPFTRLMGTSCTLTWREDNDMERLWVVTPAHPIAAGIDRYFDLPHTETYGEPFDVPTPDETVFIGWYEGGEVFRSGCCWQRGRGRVFYFQPGHETLPIYYDSRVRTVLINAVRWAQPTTRVAEVTCPHVEKPTIKFDV